MAEHLLVTIGKARFSDPKRHLIPFVNDIEQDKFLNDIENTPHAFVLACLMDRQIKAERAWSIPFRIKEIVGSFNIDDLASVYYEWYAKQVLELNNITDPNFIKAGETLKIPIYIDKGAKVN